ncbi:MAG: hypothetical protein COC17_01440 [Hyphomicrobiales bacterium]|nr:tripartite tricarboxylate transporter TctB family protein [Hyphomicrobiales bacterium]PCH51308.1 MAG: hypothetical protein COC17_01440 [Hyphomicrobiales bacterium]
MNVISLRFTIATILAVIGITAFIIGLQYDFGSSQRMGPGYFPLVLSGALTVLAVWEAFSVLFNPSSDEQPSLDWRPFAAILTAVLGFAFAISFFGLIPAFIVVIGLSSLSEHKYGLKPALILAFFVSLGAWLLFAKLLGITLSLFKFGF